MRFLELPTVGHLINLDHIYTIEHEIIGIQPIAIVRFSDNTLITIRGLDAQFLVDYVVKSQITFEDLDKIKRTAEH